MASIKLPDLFGVEGLVAVVTGGSSGIGLMMAQALEANGAIVYIIGRRLEPLEKAAKTATRGNIIPIQGDVGSKDSLVKVAAQIKEKQGYINLICANAGTTGPLNPNLNKNSSIAEISSTFLSWTDEEFTQTLAVNITGVFFTVAAFLELLDEGNKRSENTLKQKSQVILTSSIGGLNRTPMGWAYAASKSAVVHMGKQLASFLAPHDIRSNIIAPGFFPSDMTVGLIQHLDNAKWPKDVVPAQRAGDAEDMTGLILFLASRAGAYLNGVLLIPDGGQLSLLPSVY